MIKGTQLIVIVQLSIIRIVQFGHAQVMVFDTLIVSLAYLGLVSQPYVLS